MLYVKPERCFLDRSNVVWQPLVYANREDLNPCCDFRSYKISARYVFHKTAPSWRGHLWITHLDFHPSCAVQPHKVHWRTDEEEKLQVLLHLLTTTNVAFRRSEASSTPTALSAYTKNGDRSRPHYRPLCFLFDSPAVLFLHHLFIWQVRKTVKTDC
jgi:hypothetical protein